MPAAYRRPIVDQTLAPQMQHDSEPRAEATQSREESPHKGKTGWVRIWNAFWYSVAGLKAAYLNEDAFRQEILLAAVLIPLALVVGVGRVERVLMVSSVLLVLIVELLNSAVEATVDRVSLENHRLAKRAKDIGSASVLVSLVNVAVVWGLVLF
jgi:diacylglycerol kinase (ATP)